MSIITLPEAQDSDTEEFSGPHHPEQITIYDQLMSVLNATADEAEEYSAYLKEEEDALIPEYRFKPLLATPEEMALIVRLSATDLALMREEQRGFSYMLVNGAVRYILPHLKADIETMYIPLAGGPNA